MSDISGFRQSDELPNTCEIGDQPSKDRRKDRLIRMKAVIARTGLSATTINRREAAGSFPKREHIGIRSVAWYESDIGDFIAAPLTYRSC